MTGPELKRAYDKPRRYARRPLQGKVAVFCGDRFRFAEAVTISEEGIYLRFALSIPVGSDLELHFFLPGGGFVKLSARVIYVLPDGVGAAFQAVDAGAKNLIRSYVAEVAPV